LPKSPHVWLVLTATSDLAQYCVMPKFPIQTERT